MTELYKYEAVLRDLYWDQEMSMSEVAKELECSTMTIKRWLDKLDIETRNFAGNGDKPWHDEDTLRELYKEKRLSKHDIADRFGVGVRTITIWMKKHNIESRGQYEEIRKRPASHYWRNGYELSSSGFDDNDVYIHRLIAVAEHGVDKVKNMHVHHKNEIKWDNRPKNLQLMTPSEHMSHHN